VGSESGCEHKLRNVYISRNLHYSKTGDPRKFGNGRELGERRHDAVRSRDCCSRGDYGPDNGNAEAALGKAGVLWQPADLKLYE